MNIFYTNRCPVVCAIEHCNTHTNKMLCESVQLLSTAHRLLDGDGSADSLGCVKKTHINHPSNIWVRQSSQHYQWLQQMALALSEAYTERTGKKHAYADLIVRLEKTPVNLDDRGFQEPPVAAPDEFKKIKSRTQAYQQYLNWKFQDWTTRTDKRKMRVEFFYGKPEWVVSV